MYIDPTKELLEFFNIAKLEEGEPCSSQATQSSSTVLCPRWDRTAINYLITFYKENINNFKSTTMKNEHVWKIITDKMRDSGYNYSKAQVENKFKYLKSRYIKKKDNMSCRGTGESPVVFDYFDEFDDMFGKNHNIEPIALASSILESPCEVDNSGSEGETPKKKSRLEKEVSVLASLLNKKEHDKEVAKERRHTERQELSKQAINVYEQMMNKLIDKL